MLLKIKPLVPASVSMKVLVYSIAPTGTTELVTKKCIAFHPSYLYPLTSAVETSINL